MITHRYLANTVRQDCLAKHKIAFISGPRQVGKSTLARTFVPGESNYFLYDDEAFRRAWVKSARDAVAAREPGPVVLDEIHKDRRWKTKLKGIYDLIGKSLPIVVTGSARLDVYRKGSDSLMGRYFPYHLHPFSVAENEAPLSPSKVLGTTRVNYPWRDLIKLGGFPEPLMGGSVQEAQRWSRLRLERLVAEDTRDYLALEDFDAFRNLTALLPESVGSLLSVESLRENVGKAHGTVKKWLETLEILYFCFMIKPYSRRLPRAIRAAPKLYLYDILRIPAEDEPRRRENLTALHLLKACHYWTETAQGEFEVCFLRDKEGREVDFCVTSNGKPWMLVECKSADLQPSKHLIDYTARLKPAWAIQLVENSGYDRSYPDLNVRVMDYQRLMAGLL